jgi:hypothetical protein
MRRVVPAHTVHARTRRRRVTAIAPPAWDRTFLYRHRDLLGQLHAIAAQPTIGTSTSTPSRAPM